MGTIEVRNFYKPVPTESTEEFVEILFKNETVRVERIVSRGQASPEGFWYDQEHNEFVMVLKGRDRLMFQGDRNTVLLEGGDYVIIPAHRKHRVEWTDPTDETVWLAAHYCPS